MRSALVPAVSLELKWKWEMEKEEITQMHVVPPSRPASWAVETEGKKKREKVESDSEWVGIWWMKKTVGRRVRNARKMVQENREKIQPILQTETEWNLDLSI